MVGHMQLSLSPEFSFNVFEKVGALSKQDLDLSTESAQIQFFTGFVDYLQKEANLDPFQAIGFIQFLAESGIDESGDKTASEEKLAGIMDWVHAAQGGAGKALGWGLTKMPQNVQNGAMMGYAGTKAQDFFNTNPIGQKLQDAWNYIKDPEHLKQIAGPLIGGIGGALLPKLWGGGTGQSVAGAVAGAGLGAAATNPGAVQGGLDWIKKQNFSSWHPGAAISQNVAKFTAPSADQSVAVNPNA